jgi:hypothetical protein
MVTKHDCPSITTTITLKMSTGPDVGLAGLEAFGVRFSMLAVPTKQPKIGDYVDNYSSS